MLQFLDDLDSSNFAKALGVMGFEGATKGTFKHGMKKQVCCITVGSIFKNVEIKFIYIFAIWNTIWFYNYKMPVRGFKYW